LFLPELPVLTSPVSQPASAMWRFVISQAVGTPSPIVPVTLPQIVLS
jgi:hypothetical protein